MTPSVTRENEMKIRNKKLNKIHFTNLYLFYNISNKMFNHFINIGNIIMLYLKDQGEK